MNKDPVWRWGVAAGKADPDHYESNGLIRFQRLWGEAGQHVGRNLSVVLGSVVGLSAAVMAIVMWTRGSATPQPQEEHEKLMKSEPPKGVEE